MFFSVRNLGLAKWNVEYILKDFSEEKNSYLQPGKWFLWEVARLMGHVYMALWLKLSTEWDCRVVLHDFKNVHSYTG